MLELISWMLGCCFGKFTMCSRMWCKICKPALGQAHISAQQPHNLTAMSASEPKMLTISAELWTFGWLHSEDTDTGPIWDKQYSLLGGCTVIPPKGQRWEVVDVCLSDMFDSINESAEKLSRYTLSTQTTLNSVHKAFPFLAPSDFSY